MPHFRYGQNDPCQVRAPELAALPVVLPDMHSSTSVQRDTDHRNYVYQYVLYIVLFNGDALSAGRGAGPAFCIDIDIITCNH